MLSFGCEFHVYFVVVFSARALGAGFRPGVFFSHGFHASTMGWTGWKFVAAITIVVTCYFCTYYFGLRPQLETKLKYDKKKKEKKKGMGLGFFTQPSKYFHTLYFQSKDLYHTSTNQDPTVLYEPSDRCC